VIGKQSRAFEYVGFTFAVEPAEWHSLCRARFFSLLLAPLLKASTMSRPDSRDR
jgi:hypothetical protein